MLDHLGNNDPVYAQASAAVISAIETVLSEGPRTRDMGGTANTVDVGRAIAECISA
jgi:tartrate dehydrogenase/decarboxylase/D-malate dehydrogenase